MNYLYLNIDLKEYLTLCGSIISIEKYTSITRIKLSECIKNSFVKKRFVFITVFHFIVLFSSDTYITSLLVSILVSIFDCIPDPIQY